VIYTIAAYSITLGSLALYLVLLQHRRREFAGELARLDSGPLMDPRSGFNVGAFLLAPIWMLRHGMVLPGVVVIVPWLAIVPLYLAGVWIPLLFVAMVPIAAGAALLFVGNRIAVAHTGLEDPGDFSASQLPWALAGVTLYLVVLPWLWYLAMATT
jgi:hypothetical protein